MQEESYLNVIDYKFVEEFAKEYCEIVFKSKKFSIAKSSDRWCVACKVGVKNLAIFHLLEFDFINIKNANKTFGQKMWREALIKKFGEKYLNDLSLGLKCELFSKQAKEKEELNKLLNQYKKVLSEENQK